MPALPGIAPARAAAFEILLRLDSGSGHCDELLRSLRVQALSPQDRNLSTNLVMGTLRWQIALDAQIRGYLKRPDDKLDPRVQMALRLGAFQLLHLDRIPPHAAISESVELAKSAGSPAAAGMANAILRKISQATRPAIAKRFRSASEMAVALAHPAWLVERWVARFGVDAAEQICRFGQVQPPTTIRLLGDAAQAKLREEGIELGPGSFLDRARVVVRGDVTATETCRSGLARIQDEGSQLVAELAGHGTAILDCCAAPGGKTAILAERNPEAQIVAGDVSACRLEQMKRLLQPVAKIAKVWYRVSDAAQSHDGEKFDLVLCDAPCSGTGTLARNPEIRHRLTPEALTRHHRRQVEILSAVMRAVASGGRLLYSTCSLETEENEAVVEESLKKVPGFRLVPMERQLEALEREGAISTSAAESLRGSAIRDGFLITLPGVHPCDGFFAALLIRDDGATSLR